MSKEHKHGNWQIGDRVVIQLTAQFWWLRYKLKGEKMPRPSLIVIFPKNSEWVTDPKEIIRAIRLDDHMGVTDMKPSDQDTNSRSSKSQSKATLKKGSE